MDVFSIRIASSRSDESDFDFDLEAASVLPVQWCREGIEAAKARRAQCVAAANEQDDTRKGACSEGIRQGSALHQVERDDPVQFLATAFFTRINCELIFHFGCLDDDECAFAILGITVNVCMLGMYFV